MCKMKILETELTETVAEQLIALSEDWERENCCHGYYKNTFDDLKGNRIFLALEGGAVVGYLFGHKEITEKTTSIYEAGTSFFEIEELYVKPAYRSRGIGRLLFQYVEAVVSPEVELIMLGTASKNYRAILHFYLDELGMEFWSARFFKKLR